MPSRNVPSKLLHGLVHGIGGFTAEEHSLIRHLGGRFGLSAVPGREPRTGYVSVVQYSNDDLDKVNAWLFVNTPDDLRVTQGPYSFDFPCIQEAIDAVGSLLSLEADATEYHRVQECAGLAERALAAQRRRKAFVLV